MSGLAGAFNPAGPVDRDAFARMAGWVAYRGPDGMRSWHGAHVAMAFAKFARTPDAIFDKQPLFDAMSDTCVVFDGRLDNREELAFQLDVRLTDETCDVALVAAAYRRWGTDCAVRLLGDFSLAVWDGRERRVFLARDIMGIRPLFYREVNGVWWWASDQRALLEVGTTRINEGFLGEHLNGRVVSIDETIYWGIHRLPMAHALVVERGQARRCRYWRPAAEARAEYRSPSDYVHHYKALLGDAVRARLRMRGNAALLLSSGIDSTSIAAEIAALREQGVGAAAAVKTFSMTVPGDHRCEGAVIQEVLDRLQLPSQMVPASKPAGEEFAEEAAASLDVPESASSGMMRSMLDASAAGGRSIVFTGYGGNQWFESSYGELADLLRTGRLVAAAGWLASVSNLEECLAVPFIARQAVWMTLPPRVKGVLRRLLRRSPVAPWIDAEFAKKHRLADRLRRTLDVVEFPSLTQFDIFRLATDGDVTFRGDIEERFMAARGQEFRHPLMDRRIIEFSLTLPRQLRWSRGVSKIVMREAMSDILPPSVTVSPRRDDFGFLGLKVLSGFGGVARLRAAEPVRRGWVRTASIDALYPMLERGTTRALWPLCSIVGIDFWLRALQDRTRAQLARDYGRQASHLGVS